LPERLKIALINPESPADVYYFPTGLCYISSYLKKYSEVNPDIAIYNIDSSNRDKVVEFEPDIIGITCFTHSYSDALELSEYYRSIVNDALLILGGCHISVIPESLGGEFDYAVIGEGEQTMLEIVSLVASGKSDEIAKIDGVAYRSNGKVVINKPRAIIEDLDEIPFPERDSVEEAESIIRTDHPGWFGALGLRYMQLTTSRGCPYRCIFCQPSVMWGKYRMNSPEYIAAEIEYIYNKFGINAILIEDDLFTGSKSRVARLIELLEDKKLLGRIRYYIAGRTSQIDSDWADMLGRMGVCKVEFGIESGSDPIAAYLKTGKTSTEINKRAVTLLNSRGIGVFGSFIAGAPPETMNDLNETFKMIHWIRKSSPLNTCGIGIATPLPGTGLWEYAVKRNLIDTNNFDWRKLSTLKKFPESEADMVYLNEHIPADRMLKEIKKLQFRLKLGSPREFIKALPRRLKKLTRRIFKIHK